MRRKKRHAVRSHDYVQRSNCGPLTTHLDSLAIDGEPGSPIHSRAFGTMRRQGKSGNLSNADEAGTLGGVVFPIDISLDFYQ